MEWKVELLRKTNDKLLASNGRKPTFSCCFCELQKAVEDMWWCVECQCAFCSRCGLAVHQSHHRPPKILPVDSRRTLQTCYDLLLNVSEPQDTHPLIQQYFQEVQQHLIDKLKVPKPRSEEQVLAALLETTFELDQPARNKKAMKNSVPEKNGGAVKERVRRIAEEFLMAAESNKDSSGNRQTLQDEKFMFLSKINPKMVAEIVLGGPSQKVFDKIRLEGDFPVLSVVRLQEPPKESKNLQMAFGNANLLAVFSAQRLDYWTLRKNAVHMQGTIILPENEEFKSVFLAPSADVQMVQRQNKLGVQSLQVFRKKFLETGKTFPVKFGVGAQRLLAGNQYCNRVFTRNTWKDTICQCQIVLHDCADMDKVWGEQVEGLSLDVAPIDRLTAFLALGTQYLVTAQGAELHILQLEGNHVTKSSKMFPKNAVRHKVVQLEVQGSSLLVRTRFGIRCVCLLDLVDVMEGRKEEPRFVQWKDPRSRFDAQVEKAIVLDGKICLLSLSSDQSAVLVYDLGFHVL